ncbi:MAG: hypothetical protein NT027_16260 [Proteobacteria bacterium]|nr:hypothetical protein [Pseudomonadota bacterium]
MKKFGLSLLVLAGFGFVPSLKAQADQFNVDQMPAGAEVTVPGAAKTIVSLSSPVKVGSTDLPQTISIVPVGADNGPSGSPVSLSIFDSRYGKTQRVQVSPGSPFLYSFKGLSTITVQSAPNRNTKTKGALKNLVRLKIESDKPLTLAR